MTSYRKLPGRRRGFLFGSSLWMADDHLLLVKSARFREEYRRFYFRDIQAIVTADAMRFHLSTRSAAIGGVCALLLAILLARFSSYAWLGWTALAILFLAWGYVSAYRSCRCRVYTAVSGEDLPSLYRTWNAARFLETVEPYIARAQGAIEGDWAEAVEDRQVGPLPEGRLPNTTPAKAGGALLDPSAKLSARTPLSLLFAGSLCVGGLANLLALRTPAGVGRWILLGFILLQLAAAVGVLVEGYLGRVRRGLRTLAIVVLAATGLWYYAVTIVASMALAYQNGNNRNSATAAAQMEPINFLYYPLSRGIAGGMNLLCGLAAVALLARGERPA
jgi:hypothetical protein